MIAIIDYDAGNIKSVEKALLALGQEVEVTSDREKILSADKVILPGVGAFGDAMANLRESGLDEVMEMKIYDSNNRLRCRKYKECGKSHAASGTGSNNHKR